MKDLNWLASLQHPNKAKRCVQSLYVLHTSQIICVYNNTVHCHGEHLTLFSSFCLQGFFYWAPHPESLCPKQWGLYFIDRLSKLTWRYNEHTLSSLMQPPVQTCINLASRTWDIVLIKASVSSCFIRGVIKEAGGDHLNRRQSRPSRWRHAQ